MFKIYWVRMVSMTAHGEYRPMSEWWTYDECAKLGAYSSDYLGEFGVKTFWKCEPMAEKK